ncbi:cyclin-dependent kinase E-1-like [Histomonas meleagridis]|uniref:cyclin-dependent kinase E-1-like n=1 Tax=Histomonas meleagridis TaxID=135588 RepID=UPI00355A6CBF|nr:cyclin-dependent kinase E-1-like [Histomonas meleagridis]KAH0807092.1 cyclin-dependent kinase E-1-like [Histomonas meleagridis]
MIKNQNQFQQPSFEDSFDVKKNIGGGTYGQVFLAERKNSNDKKKYSVKQSSINSDERKISPSIFRELVFLSEINYPHIIHPFSKDIFLDKNRKTLSFVYEYGAINVQRVIEYYSNRSNVRMSPVVAKSILFQLLLALDYLHQRSITHCDITPSNILLMSPNSEDMPGIVKLIDFGLSRIIDNSKEQRNFGVVTVWYRAPELLLGDPYYDQKIDIWAAGCIFAELIQGKVLFQTTNKIQEKDPTEFNSNQLNKIIEVMGAIEYNRCPMEYKYRDKLKSVMYPRKPAFDDMFADKPPSAVDLLLRMLKIFPNERISAKEALMHPYFNESPVCAMNVTGQISPAEWNELENYKSN